MCYEFERDYLRQLAKEARQAMEERERKRNEQRQPAKPEPGKTPQQPDPVPV